MLSTKLVFVTEFIIRRRLVERSDTGIIDGNNAEIASGSKTQSSIDIIMLEDYLCVSALFKCYSRKSASERI